MYKAIYKLAAAADNDTRTQLNSSLNDTPTQLQGQGSTNNSTHSRVRSLQVQSRDLCPVEQEVSFLTAFYQ